MSSAITLDGKRVKVKYDRHKQLYVYTGGQKQPQMYDLLALGYLNREKTKSFRSMWDLILIRTEIELRTRENDPDINLEEWVVKNLKLNDKTKGGGA